MCVCVRVYVCVCMCVCVCVCGGVINILEGILPMTQIIKPLLNSPIGPLQSKVN